MLIPFVSSVIKTLPLTYVRTYMCARICLSSTCHAKIRIIINFVYNLIHTSIGCYVWRKTALPKTSSICYSRLVKNQPHQDRITNRTGYRRAAITFSRDPNAVLSRGGDCEVVLRESARYYFKIGRIG